MAKTDIAQQIDKIREDALHALSIGDKQAPSNVKTIRYDLERLAAKSVKIPTTITIDSPEIEGVEACELQVSARTKGLWIKTENDVHRFLARATAAQFMADNAVVDRRRGKKRSTVGMDDANPAELDGQIAEVSVINDDAVPPMPDDNSADRQHEASGNNEPDRVPTAEMTTPVRVRCVKGASIKDTLRSPFIYLVCGVYICEIDNRMPWCYERHYTRTPLSSMKS